MKTDEVINEIEKVVRGKRGVITMAAKEARANIVLACTECKQRNYNTKKNRKNSPDRIELKKYCRFCRKHTVHRETK